MIKYIERAQSIRLGKRISGFSASAFRSILDNRESLIVLFFSAYIILYFGILHPARNNEVFTLESVGVVSLLVLILFFGHRLLFHRLLGLLSLTFTAYLWFHSSGCHSAAITCIFFYCLVFGCLPGNRNYELAVKSFVRIGAGAAFILLFSACSLVWIEALTISHPHIISLVVGSAFFLILLARRFDQDLFVPMSKEIVILAGEMPKLYLGVYSLVFFILLRTISPDFMGDTINYHMYMASLFSRDKMFLPEFPFWYIFTFLQYINEVAYSYFLKISLSGFVLGRLWSTTITLFIFFLVPATVSVLRWSRLMSWMLCCGFLTASMTLSMVGTMNADPVIAGLVAVALVWSIRFASNRTPDIFAFLMAITFSCILFGARVSTAFFVPMGVLILICIFISRKEIDWLTKGGVALMIPLIALFFGGFWYLRSFLATGNPVFPFFNALFRSNYFPHSNVLGALVYDNYEMESIWGFFWRPFHHALSVKGHYSETGLLVETLLCYLACFGILLGGRKHAIRARLLSLAALVCYYLFLRFVVWGRYVVPFMPIGLLLIGTYLQARSAGINKRLLAASGAIFILISFVCAQDWGGYRTSTCIPKLARQPNTGKQEENRFVPEFWEEVNGKIPRVPYMLCELRRGGVGRDIRYCGTYMDPVLIDLSGYLLNEHAKTNNGRTTKLDIEYLLTTKKIFDNYLRETMIEKYRWRILGVESLGKLGKGELLLVNIEINKAIDHRLSKLDLWKPYFIYDHLRLEPIPPEMEGLKLLPYHEGDYRHNSELVTAE